MKEMILMQYLGLMDTSIPYNIVQSAANPSTKNYPLPQLFSNNPNILTEKKAKSFIDLVKAAQINSFTPLKQKQVFLIRSKHKNSTK